MEEIYKKAQEDINYFRNILIKLICDGKEQEIERLLVAAPADFKDSAELYFTVVSHSERMRESKVISPVGLAVNVGKFESVKVLLAMLTGISIEYGVESKSQNNSYGKQTIYKKKSPLQYAASLGLHRIAQLLLDAGANSDGVGDSDRTVGDEYGAGPIFHCLDKALLF